MNLYHLLNRGVEKRDIVSDERDRQRFVTNLFVMNNKKAIENLGHVVARDGFTDFVNLYKDRDRLVNVHGWCLMNNHFHLLVSEKTEGGISTFLRKLNIGYANYFNERHRRSGSLFQGRTKKIVIENNAHFLWILHYIHFNPLDYARVAGNWRTQCLATPTKAFEWLNTYPWSSWNDYQTPGLYSPILEGSYMFKDREYYAKEAARILRSFNEAPLSIKVFE